MLNRFLASLMLLLLAGSALGGVPLHGPEQGECPMAAGMESMDCCKKAQERRSNSEVAAAKLCCAVNCQENAPVSSSGTANLSIRTLPASQPVGVIAVSTSPGPVFLTEEFVERRVTPNDDHPIYIRHLALLI